jgi:uncharacterized membrane protein YhaH (DUF805 family)
MMSYYFHNLFHGRINRATYLIGMLLWIFFVFFTIFKNKSELINTNPLLAVVSLLIALFIYLSLSLRRAHDLGHSKWDLLNTLTNFVNLFFLNGQKEKNKFGKPPKPGIDLKSLLGF